jgi:hypothetical protein
LKCEVIVTAEAVTHKDFMCANELRSLRGFGFGFGSGSGSGSGSGFDFGSDSGFSFDLSRGPKQKRVS